MRTVCDVHTQAYCVRYPDTCVHHLYLSNCLGTMTSSLVRPSTSYRCSTSSHPTGCCNATRAGKRGSLPTSGGSSRRAIAYTPFTQPYTLLHPLTRPHIPLHTRTSPHPPSQVFDIYRTMRVLLAWPDASPGDATPSLLEPMPEGRTCADADIPDMYCACRNPEAQRSFSAVVEVAHGGAVPASAGAATGLPTAKAAVEAR